MEEYGSQVQIEYESQNFDGISMKTGIIAGTMICSESQYQSLPYRGNIHGRVVLITVTGQQNVCLRFGDIGHQRSYGGPLLRLPHSLDRVAHVPFPLLLLLLVGLFQLLLGWQ
jgi:hypothetical protein